MTVAATPSNPSLKVDIRESLGETRAMMGQPVGSTNAPATSSDLEVKVDELEDLLNSVGDAEPSPEPGRSRRERAEAARTVRDTWQRRFGAIRAAAPGQGIP